MMKYKNTIIIIAIFLIYSNYIKADVVDSIRFVTKANKNEYLLIFHFNITGCVKCFIEPKDILQNLERNKYLKNCKVFASVLCDRDIELKIFSRDNNWTYNLLRNDGNLLSSLKTTNDTFITIISPNQRFLHLKPGNPKENYDKIVDFLTKSD